MSQQILSYSPDKKVAKYEFSFQAKLGQGAFGTVYAGRNTQNQEIIAMKVIDKKMSSSEYQSSAIQSEIQLMKKVNSPNIVRLIDVLQTPNNTYIVTEYCNGGDLREYLKKKRTILESEALNIFKQLLIGLRELMKIGIIHRDIKPANILIHDNTFKLTDFGFAKQVQSFDETIMNSLVGTPLYMSPQILKKQYYTSKCDIWSMGLVLYEMIYGVTPWHSQNLVELMQKLDTKPLNFPPRVQISDQTRLLIQGCLQITERKRSTWESLFQHFDIISKHSSSSQMISCKDITKIEQVAILRHNSTSPNLPRTKTDMQKERRMPSVYIPLIKEKLKSKQNTSDHSNQTPSTSTSNNLITDEDQKKNNETPTNPRKSENSVKQIWECQSFDEKKSCCNQMLRCILNQLDLIPTYLPIREDMEPVIQGYQINLQKCQNEFIHKQEDQLKMRSFIKEVLNYINKNQKDYFINQMEVLLLLMMNYYQIVNLNVITNKIVITPHLLEQIKKNQQIQQDQFNMEVNLLKANIKEQMKNQ